MVINPLARVDVGGNPSGILNVSIFVSGPFCWLALHVPYKK